MGKTIDITGQRFGRLLVIQQTGKNADNRTLWQCRCDCGNHHIVNSGNLRQGSVKSCGCKRGYRTHGMAGKANRHYLYHTWKLIRNRCNNPKGRAYKWYGARGIKFYEYWNTDFSIFVNGIVTGIGNRPPGMTLDRIDNNGHYEPGNVKWSTPKEQVDNRRPPEEWDRKCRRIEQFSETELVAELIRRKSNYVLPYGGFGPP
jgi:hypothetical protein